MNEYKLKKYEYKLNKLKSSIGINSMAGGNLVQFGSGGNAIKDPVTKKSICDRLPKEQYERVKEMVISKLRAEGINCEIVLELPGKDSFGDLDVLYVEDKGRDMRIKIMELFNIVNQRHIVTNGNVMSSAFECTPIGMPNKYFQIDFIKTDSIEHLNMARFYFSYGDIGSIIGRIFNYYGLKFGDKGLWCEVYENTAFPDKPFNANISVGNKIMLSDNAEHICRYAGLDYNFWKYTIPELAQTQMPQERQWKEIFDWIKSSRLFKPEIFEKLNHDHRKRAGTLDESAEQKNGRPFYQAFLRYIEITSVDRASAKEGETGGENFNHQHVAIQYFRKEADLQSIISNITIKKIRDSKFNGINIIEEYAKNGITITRENIGVKIQLFKDFCLKNYRLSSWEQYLDRYTRDQIQQDITTFVFTDINGINIIEEYAKNGITITRENIGVKIQLFKRFCLENYGLSLDQYLDRYTRDQIQQDITTFVSTDIQKN
jgi:hypothetical protein